MTTIDQSSYWFTVIDVSEALGVPLRRLYDLLEDGELRGRQIGRTVMIARPEVEKLQARLSAG